MIWVAAIGEKVREMRITVDYRELADKKAKPIEHLLHPSEWRMWKTRQVLDGRSDPEQNAVLYYQRVLIGSKGGLKDGTKYVFWVKWDKNSNPDAAFPNEPKSKHFGSMQDFSRRKYLYVRALYDQSDKAVATATTLPANLPAAADPKPFTVMLGSCFYRPSDPDGLAGKVFYEMPWQRRPNLKLLCGDQVYLDNPWEETTFPLGITGNEKLRKLILKKYIQTWTQMSLMSDKKKSAVGGFNVLLRHGANYFASDDHEFWNNAPNKGGVGLGLTLLRFQRRFWFREGAELFRIFQSLSPLMTFSVPPVSFCIADTRINRNIKGLRFMENDDLDALLTWIDRLEGPGVISLGQPLLAKKGNWLARLFDRGLADYDYQFNQLKTKISESRHSIVLLTGDVHFGRYSECDLRKPTEDETTVPQFIEIISSPLRVVDGVWGKGKVNGYEDAYDTFGTGVESMELARHHNHFVTVEFTQDASGVQMSVWEWPIPHKSNQVTKKGSLRKTVTLT